MSGARLAAETFERDPTFDLQRYAKRSFGTFQETPVEVVLRFDAAAARDASAFLFHPDQTTEENADGSLTVRPSAGKHLLIPRDPNRYTPNGRCAAMGRQCHVEIRPNLNESAFGLITNMWEYTIQEAAQMSQFLIFRGVMWFLRIATDVYAEDW